MSRPTIIAIPVVSVAAIAAPVLYGWNPLAIVLTFLIAGPMAALVLGLLPALTPGRSRPEEHDR